MIEVSVVGSLHLDIIVEAPRLPSRDETLMGSSWRMKCGGKGGNQAGAAARFGARTAFGGRTGQDDFGERLRANLVSAGVDIDCVGIDPTQGSGMSAAISEANGEYGAVVVSGANLAIDAAVIARDWKLLWNCKVLLLQNEVTEEVNITAASAAKARGATIVLNAAPARKMPDDLLALIDMLVVNRVEAAMLSGMDDPGHALETLASSTCDIVLTLGGDGVLLRGRDGQVKKLPALPVRMISSHGAGDCFCGALAARLAAGDGLLDATQFARTAAGLFVSMTEEEQSDLNAAKVFSTP